MAKKKTILDFGKVASDSDSNSDINNKSDDILSSISSKKSKEQTHTYKGFYLENRVAATIDRLTDGKGKGAKSEFVNEVIKKYLIDNELL